MSALEAIREILRRNGEERNGRDWVLFSELREFFEDRTELKKQLNELYKFGAIKVGDTVNDKYVKLI